MGSTLRGTAGLARGVLIVPFVAGFLFLRKWKSVPMWLTLVLFVAIGIKIESSAPVVWSQTAGLFSRLQHGVDGLRAQINQALGCSEVFLRIHNRLVAMYRAIMVLVAEDVGYEIGYDVRGQVQIVTVGDYCDFTSAVQSFFLDFLSLVTYPVFLVLDVIEQLAPALSDITAIGDIDVFEFVEEIIYPVFAAMVQFVECVSSPPNSLTYCICKTRFANISSMPAPLNSVVMCMNEDYDGTGDPIACGFAPIVGVGAIIDGLNTALMSFSAVLSGTKSGVNALSGFANSILGGIGDIDGACDAYGSIPSAVRRHLPIPDEFFQLCDIITGGVVAEANNAISLSNQVASAIDSISLPPPIPEICPSSTMDLGYRPGPTWHIAERVEARTARVWAALADLHRAMQGAASERFANNTVRLQRWSHILSVAYDTATARDIPHPREIVASLRAGGVHASMFLEHRHECTPHTRAFVGAAPPPVTLNAANALETFFGAALLVILLFLCVAACPPACFAVVLVLLGTSTGALTVIFSSGGAQIMAALDLDRINEVYALPTGVLLSQKLGNNYLDGGLANIDPFAIADDLMPQLVADANMVASSVISAPFCFALPLGWACPPPPRRGDGIFDNFVGALYCVQGQACDTVANCSGRAVGCFDNMCRCWGSVPETLEIPEIRLFYSDALDCSAYGYTNDVRVPFLDPGGLSLQNAWNTFGNAWRVARDTLGGLADSGVIGPPALVVAFFLAVIPLTARGGRRLFVIFAAVLATQYALHYFKAAVVLFPASRGNPACVVQHLPSAALWYLVVQLAQPLLLAAVLSGIASSLAAVALGVAGLAVHAVLLLVTASLRWRKFMLARAAEIDALTAATP